MNRLKIYNLEFKNKFDYQRNLYKLPNYYAVIPNVKTVYYVVVENKKQTHIFDYNYNEVFENLKLNYDNLQLNMYVFEFVKQHKQIILTDIFVMNGQKILSPHWCVRWLHFENIDIPKIKKYSNIYALKYDLNNSKGQNIIRDVFNTTKDHIFNNNNPKHFLVYGTGCVTVNNQTVPVTIFAANNNGTLIPTAYCKKFTSSFYQTIDSPDIEHIQTVQIFTKFRVAFFENFKYTGKMIEVNPNAYSVQNNTEKTLNVVDKFIYCDDIFISNVIIDKYEKTRNNDAFKNALLFEQHKALQQWHDEAKFIKLNELMF